VNIRGVFDSACNLTSTAGYAAVQVNHENQFRRISLIQIGHGDLEIFAHIEDFHFSAFLRIASGARSRFGQPSLRVHDTLFRD
jgi:hypothetical protein